MLAFEALSGIKVNYSKTSMYPIHTNRESNLHQLFRCQWDNFPLLYLGLPLSNKKWTVADWQFLVDKIQKRLPSWKENLLFLDDKLTLVNAVLSFIPLYTLSVFKIPITILNRIDKLRRQFLWHGSDPSKKKYIMMKWSVACLAKHLGGHGHPQS